MKWVKENEVSNVDSSIKTSGELNTFLINHQYEKVPKIDSIRSGIKVKIKK